MAAETTFLALYYATIGVVASTAYSSVPGDNRKLFVQERTSNVYTRGTISAFVFTTALLTMGGYPARALTLAAAAILTIVAALRLMIVGTAPLSFFDLAALDESLPARFERALRLTSKLPTATPMEAVKCSLDAKQLTSFSTISCQRRVNLYPFASVESGPLLLGLFGGCGRADAAEVSVFESIAISFHREVVGVAVSRSESLPLAWFRGRGGLTRLACPPRIRFGP